MWSVKANGLLLLDEHMQYKAIVRETMDAVTESLGIKVTIKTVHNSPLKFPLMSVDGTGDVLVEVQGGYGAVQSAKLKILSLLDQLVRLTQP